ncbi:hypothetical protein [Haloprofundus halophilus]|uniref:hypothetical protein n=1 Tax=Haloprofundus halophilus TaxID=2283527 RepID=UPI001300B88E|nr:hypothetical protein [Haloprofundus halophilus]
MKTYIQTGGGSAYDGRLSLREIGVQQTIYVGEDDWQAALSYFSKVKSYADLKN